MYNGTQKNSDAYLTEKNNEMSYFRFHKIHKKENVTNFEKLFLSISSFQITFSKLHIDNVLN